MPPSPPPLHCFHGNLVQQKKKKMSEKLPNRLLHICAISVPELFIELVSFLLGFGLSPVCNDHSVTPPPSIPPFFSLVTLARGASPTPPVCDGAAVKVKCKMRK